MKKYPFKFLDAYTKEDHHIFFGREQELDDLYRLVFQTNLLLLYGASGTGKTSLIRCGLANRFKDSQWLDLYVRRGTDINQSLQDTILKNIPQTVAVTAREKELDWFESLMEAETENEDQKAFIRDSKNKRRRQWILKRALIAGLFIAAIVVILFMNDRQNQTNKALILVLESLIQDADNNILDQDYEKALEKNHLAGELKRETDRVFQRYYEIAFWFNEAGRFQRTAGILDTAAVLTGQKGLIADLASLPADSAAAQRELQNIMKAIDSVGYQKLRERYYPIFVNVPEGTFTMGCDPAVDTLCQSDQTQHEVRLNDFALSTYETTWWQYYLYCQVTGNEYFRTQAKGDEPVGSIRWYGALEYCNWLSERDGLKKVYEIDKTKKDENNLSAQDRLKWTITVNWQASGYRLPTEAEWEYAAKGGRAGEDYIYSGGNGLDSLGRYLQKSKGKPQPVGSLKANALGLYDMSGNVFEWCWDWYGEYPEGPVENPIGPEKGEYRVVRGGSWLSADYYCRVSTRNRLDADVRSLSIGFRVARVP